MTGPLLRKIETVLLRRGFAARPVREILCLQLVITATALAAGTALFWLSPWPLLFGLGALLASYNFWHIARFGQAYAGQKFSPALGLRLFMNFNARLLLTGLVLFFLIVRLGAPIAPLVAGLSTTVGIIVIWGISRISRRPVKEA